MTTNPLHIASIMYDTDENITVGNNEEEEEGYTTLKPFCLFVSLLLVVSYTPCIYENYFFYQPLLLSLLLKPLLLEVDKPDSLLAPSIKSILDFFPFLLADLHWLII